MFSAACKTETSSDAKFAHFHRLIRDENEAREFSAKRKKCVSAESWAVFAGVVDAGGVEKGGGWCTHHTAAEFPQISQASW